MNRELVTQEELSDILTAKLRQIEDAGDASLTVQYRLIEPDDEGCNWEDVSVNTGQTQSTRALPYVRDIVQWARERYNLKD